MAHQLLLTFPLCSPLLRHLTHSVQRMHAGCCQLLQVRITLPLHSQCIAQLLISTLQVLVNEAGHEHPRRQQQQNHSGHAEVK